MIFFTLFSYSYTKIVFVYFAFLFIFESCNPLFKRFILKSFEDVPGESDTKITRIERPIVPSVGLSVLWIGHATCLIQIGNKVFMTDPMFTNTAGIVTKRRTKPGIQIELLEKLDFILISHIHFDHLNYGSLNLLPKSATVVLPIEGMRYTPNMGFENYQELKLLENISLNDVRITAVPVKHFNGRYGFDIAWLDVDTYSGFVIEYEGKTVFFAGDTGYDSEKFKEIGKKFCIDVALIPIAPIEPHDFMKRVHTNPEEALQIFEDTQAKFMIPIHHRTFIQGLDSSITSAQEQLWQIVAERHLDDRVLILGIGEQKILIQ